MNSAVHLSFFLKHRNLADFTANAKRCLQGTLLENAAFQASFVN